MPSFYADLDLTPKWELVSEGEVLGTLAEVRDLGIVNGKPRLQFTWSTNELSRYGKPLAIKEHFTNNLDPRTRLSARIAQITGQLPDPFQSYNVSTLVGSQCRLTIEHRTTEAGTFANVAETSRGIKALSSGSTNAPIMALALAAPLAPNPEDDDIPF